MLAFISYVKKSCQSKTFLHEHDTKVCIKSTNWKEEQRGEKVGQTVVISYWWILVIGCGRELAFWTRITSLWWEQQSRIERAQKVAWVVFIRFRGLKSSDLSVVPVWSARHCFRKISNNSYYPEVVIFLNLKEVFNSSLALSGQDSFYIG